MESMIIRHSIQNVKQKQSKWVILQPVYWKQ